MTFRDEVERSKTLQIQREKPIKNASLADIAKLRAKASTGHDEMFAADVGGGREDDAVALLKASSSAAERGKSSSGFDGTLGLRVPDVTQLFKPVVTTVAAKEEDGSEEEEQAEEPVQEGKKKVNAGWDRDSNVIRAKRTANQDVIDLQTNVASVFKELEQIKANQAKQEALITESLEDELKMLEAKKKALEFVSSGSHNTETLNAYIAEFTSASCRPDICMTPNAHSFWHISRENDKIMTDLLFREGTGPVLYMGLFRRRALTLSGGNLVDSLPPAFNFGHILLKNNQM